MPGEPDEDKANRVPNLATSSSASSATVDDTLTKENALQILRRADTARKQELLFATWDTNRDGFVYFSDVTEGLQKLRPSSDDIHLEFAAKAALKALSALSSKENPRIDARGFKDFMDGLTRETGQPMSIMSELLILCGLEMQTSQSGSALENRIKESNQATKLQSQRMKELSRDGRIVRLFQFFNKSETGLLSFSELSLMLWQLRHGLSLRQSRAEAVDTLLFLDTDSERSVTLLEFTKFVHKLGFLLHMDTLALAEMLLQVARDSESVQPSADDTAVLSSMQKADCTAKSYETLADRKLHLLFELWDKDGDGLISFAELALGLRKLSPPEEPVTQTAADAAEAMLVFDADSDQNMNRAEFARFVNAFCEGCETDFNTLSEFLILLAAMEDSPSEELAFLLAKDKVDRAIAGLDASWQSSSQQGELSDQSKAGQSDWKQDGDKDERAAEVSYEEGVSDGGRDTATAERPVSDEEQGTTNLVGDVKGTHTAGNAS